MGVLEVSKIGKEFPINLDDVWQLVYPRKDHAVRVLTEDFIQDVDYQVFLKNGENSKGGRPSSKYMLTVSCMEFFIARKVRAVFEVYRLVFHGVTNGTKKVPRTFAEALRLAADQQELIEEQQKQIQAITPKADFADQLFRKDAKIKIGTAGKVLNLPFGSKTLFMKLRELGILFKNSTECCQRYLDAGYFVMESKLIKMGNADKMISVTYATLKGLAYIGYLFGTKPNTEQAKSLFKKALQIDAAENKHLELTVNL